MRLYNSIIIESFNDFLNENPPVAHDNSQNKESGKISSESSKPTNESQIDEDKKMDQLEAERDMRKAIHKYMSISDTFNLQIKQDGSVTFEMKAGKILYASKLNDMIKHLDFSDISIYVNGKNELEVKLIK